MTNGHSFLVRTGVAALAGALWFVASPSAQNAPLALGTARLTIAGTSNIHDYTASTTAIRLTRVQLGTLPAGAGLLDVALNPGVVEAFEISIPAKSLASQKDGLDKNMHAALKVTEHPDITFKLLRFENRPAPATGQRAIGVLRVAGGRPAGHDRHRHRAQRGRTAREGHAGAADDRLRRGAAEGDDGDAQDRSQGHHHLRGRRRA